MSQTNQKSSIVDFSSEHEAYVKYKPRNNNAISLQHPHNSVFAGATGSGKTVFLENLLLTSGIKMTYDRVWLICPSLNEPAYLFLQDTYRKLQEKFEKATGVKLKYSIFTHIDKAEDIPSPEAFDDSQQHVIIVDDFCDNKAVNQKIHALCIKNRKANASLIYLTQDFFTVPKMIRRQVQNGYCVLWNTASKRELGLYAGEFSLGIDRDELKKMFEEATKVPYHPFLIDFRNKNKKWRFRAALEVPLGPDTPPEESTPVQEKMIKTIQDD